MAGIQSCFRIRLNVINGLRLVKNNDTIHQSTRGRHFLSFQASFFKNGQYINRSRLFPSRISIYRFASTNTTNLETLSPVTDSKTSQNLLATNEASSTVTQTSPTVSDTNIIIDESTLPPIPSALQPEPEVVTAVLNHLGEPTFKSLGLGSWWPSGILQQVMEYLHVNAELPWWAVIAIVTVCLRTLAFPLTILSKRNAIHMNNHMPQLQVIQMKMTQARQTGNYYDAAYHMKELQDFIAEKKISMLGGVVPGLLQAPIFLSMVAALTGMSKAPVESMKTGGLFWFENLTVTDPYYILPVVISTTVFITIRLGTDNVPLHMQNTTVKFIMMGIPLIMFPFIINFSSAVVWYWTVTNFVLLTQWGLLRIPAVAKLVNLPPLVHHDPSKLKVDKKKGFDGFKESMINMKIVKELEDRERLNAITFEKAGTGPIPRTFKKSPIKTE